jgi:hypothetical protein
LNEWYPAPSNQECVHGLNVPTFFESSVINMMIRDSPSEERLGVSVMSSASLSEARSSRVCATSDPSDRAAFSPERECSLQKRLGVGVTRPGPVDHGVVVEALLGIGMLSSRIFSSIARLAPRAVRHQLSLFRSRPIAALLRGKVLHGCGEKLPRRDEWIKPCSRMLEART